MEAVLQITYVSWTAFIVWFSKREDKLEKEKNGDGSESVE